MTPSERIRCGTARPWLPSSAMKSDIAERALRQVVNQWSSTWFKNPKLRLAGSLQVWRDDGQDWRVFQSGIAMSTSAKTRPELAGLLLEEKLEGEKLSGADRHLLDELAKGCLDALAADLSEALGLSRQLSWQSAGASDLENAWSCSISPPVGATTIGLAFASELLVSLIRRTAPVQRPDAALSSLESGLDDQIVTISALLGNCHVSLRDLASLEAGDVLCLDGNVAQPAHVALDYASSSAMCRIDQDGETLQLRLIE